MKLMTIYENCKNIINKISYMYISHVFLKGFTILYNNFDILPY